MPRQTLALDPGKAQQVGLQINDISTDVGHLGTPHKSQRIPAFVGMLELRGDLCVGKHILRLLVFDHRHVSGANSVPGRIPSRRCTGDIHFSTGDRKEMTTPQIMGVDTVTLGDLETLVAAIDAERMRLESMRVPAMRERIMELVYLSNTVADYMGKVKRGDMSVEQVPIQPASARMFLKMFQTSETIPHLIDEAAAPAPAPAPAPITLFDVLQRIKWDIETNQHVSVASNIRSRLDAMERRIVSYSTSETPMPDADAFLAELGGIQAAFRREAA